MINELFKINSNREAKSKSEDASSEILRILENFIIDEKDLFKVEQSKSKQDNLVHILLNNRWGIIFFSFIVICTLLLLVLVLLGISNSQVNIFFSLIRFLMFSFTGYIC